MELLLDARKLEHTGIGRVTRELVRGLAAEHPDTLPGELGILTLPHGASGGAEAWGLASAERIAVVKARPFSLTEGYALRRAFRHELAGRTRLYHVPHIHLPPLGHPAAARPFRVVVTVHDMIPLISPDYGPLKRAAFRRALFRAVAQADAVIVPSEATHAAFKRHVVEAGALRSSAVPPCHVIAPPLAAAFCHVTLQDDVASDAPVLAFASRRWHKNTALVLAAYADSPERVGPVHLVGTAADLTPGLRRRVAALRRRHSAHRLRLLGRLDDAALRDAYANALALLWPSRMEGYGLPVLEAMACGAPVLAGPQSCALAANAQVLPLEEPQAWANAIHDLRKHTTTRQERRRQAHATYKQQHQSQRSLTAHRDLYTALWPG